MSDELFVSRSRLPRVLSWHIDMFDEALVVAVEHVRWCRSQGMSPAEIFASLDEPVPRNPGFDDAVWMVGRLWNSLPRHSRVLRSAA